MVSLHSNRHHKTLTFRVAKVILHAQKSLDCSPILVKIQCGLVVGVEKKCLGALVTLKGALLITRFVVLCYFFFQWSSPLPWAYTVTARVSEEITTNTPHFTQ